MKYFIVYKKGVSMDKSLKKWLILVTILASTEFDILGMKKGAPIKQEIWAKLKAKETYAYFKHINYTNQSAGSSHSSFAEVISNPTPFDLSNERLTELKDLDEEYKQKIATAASAKEASDLRLELREKRAPYVYTMSRILVRQLLYDKIGEIRTLMAKNLLSEEPTLPPAALPSAKVYSGIMVTPMAPEEKEKYKLTKNGENKVKAAREYLENNEPELLKYIVSLINTVCSKQIIDAILTPKQITELLKTDQVDEIRRLGNKLNLYLSYCHEWLDVFLDMHINGIITNNPGRDKKLVARLATLDKILITEKLPAYQNVFQNPENVGDQLAINFYKDVSARIKRAEAAGNPARAQKLRDYLNLFNKIAGLTEDTITDLLQKAALVIIDVGQARSDLWYLNSVLYGLQQRYLVAAKLAAAS